MKVNKTDTNHIINALKAYYAILSHKKHRSVEEIDLFVALQPILSRIEQLKKESENTNPEPEENNSPGVCD